MKTLVRHCAFLALLSSLILSPLSFLTACGDTDNPVVSTAPAGKAVVEEAYQVATLEGHEHWVSSVSFPAEGTMLASGAFDNTIKLWDVASRQNIATLEGHRSWVWSVSLSPDGGLLASGSSDGTIKLWDVASRQNIATLTGSDSAPAAILSVAFSPDGTMLATGSDGAIKLWDVASRENIATLEGHVDWVWSVSFSPNGAFLASGLSDGTIKLWDVASRQNIATFEGHTSWVQSVSFSPSEALLASGSDDNTIKLWHVVSRPNIATFEGHASWVNSVSFSPDGALLASGSSDGTIKLWDVASRENIATLEGNTSEVRSVSFAPDEALLASGLSDGTISLWDVSEWMRSSSEQAQEDDDEDQQTTAVELEGVSTSHDSVREDDGSETITLTVTLDKAAGASGETITLAMVSPTQGKTAQRGEDFDATLDETITIAKGQRTGTAQLTLTPKDNTTADGDKAFAVEATSSSGHQALINIKIIDDDEMDFAFAGEVEDQAYTAGLAITPLVLPEATGGEGEVMYRVSDLPAGLTFDAATRTISGTPKAPTDEAVEVTVSAEDSTGVIATLTFSITVNPPLIFDDFFDLFGADGG